MLTKITFKPVTRLFSGILQGARNLDRRNFLFQKESPLLNHSFDDEVIRHEAELISRENPKNSDEDNWYTAIESLKYKQYQFLTSDGNKKIEELYLNYRDYLKHENILINYRTTWFITIQSFLITTFGFSYQKKFEVVSNATIMKNLTILHSTLEKYNHFIISLSIIGIITSIVAFFSITAAIIAGKAVRNKWTHIYTYISLKNHTIIGHLPKIVGGGNEWAYKYGKIISQFLPSFFFFFWIGVALSIGFFQLL